MIHFLKSPWHLVSRRDMIRSRRSVYLHWTATLIPGPKFLACRLSISGITLIRWALDHRTITLKDLSTLQRRRCLLLYTVRDSTLAPTSSIMPTSYRLGHPSTNCSRTTIPLKLRAFLSERQHSKSKFLVWLGQVPLTTPQLAIQSSSFC
jgi:hypothetical protein